MVYEGYSNQGAGGMAEGAQVTTEKFVPIWADWQLRQYLVDTCKACTRSIELQEDCLQEAALAISQEEGDGTMEHYGNVGRKAIVRYRSKERRERRGKAKVLRKYRSYWKERGRFR